MARPTLRQIDCLIAVRDTGGFSRAAERLGLSQPALSQQIRDLEDLLGLRMVDRTTRKVALTAAGHAYAARAEIGLGELERAQREAHGLANLAAGQLRIAAPPLLASGVLPKVMASFQRAHPGITLGLTDVPSDAIVARLRDGRVDLGIGTFPAGLPDLEHRPLWRDTLMVFAPPHHPIARESSVTWAALKDEAIVALGRESGLRALLEQGFEQAGNALRPTQEVSQIATVLALVEAGFGLAVLPSYARLAPQAAGLAALPFESSAVGRQIVALTPRDRSPPPTIAPFLDMLIRALRREAIAPQEPR